MILKLSRRNVRQSGRRASFTLGMMLATGVFGVGGVCHAAPKIFFVSDRGAGMNVFSIWTANADGTSPTKVVDLATDPALSRDGTMLAYSKNQDIYIAKVSLVSGAVVLKGLDNSANPTALTIDGTANREVAPSFSPDGSQLIFERGAAGSTDLYRINTDNSNSGNAQPAFNATGEDISPRFVSATQIVFARSESTGAGHSLVSFTLGAATSSRTIEQDGTGTSTADIGRLTVSPANNQVVYVRPSGPTNGLYRKTLGASGSPSINTSLKGDNFPAFSPDGTQIIFSSTATSRNPVGASDVFLMNSDGSGAVNLTSSAAGSNDFAPVIGDITDTTPAAPPANPSSPGLVNISEFRLSGPNGPTDEFIELYNPANTVVPIGGWSILPGNTGNTTIPIPAGTMVPGRGHYLLVNNTNGAGYSLTSYAAGDTTYTTDIPAGTVLTLFNNTGTAVDQVNSVTPATLPAPSSLMSNYSYVRRMDTSPIGGSVDSGNDIADFNVADVGTTVGPNNTTGVSGGILRLGAPGPQNLNSPITTNSIISFLPATPEVTRTGTGNSGTLSIRRILKNFTNSKITKFRFRVVGLTAGTTNSTNTTPADIRLISSTANGAVLPFKLEAPSTESAPGTGGGLNSTITLDLSGQPTGGLAPGASVTVEMLFNIFQKGTYRFLLNVEPVLGAPTIMVAPQPPKGVVPAADAEE